MSFGSSEWLPWVKNKDEALPVFKKAYDLGITTWDTANGYSNGESERIIAAAIKEYNIPREELIIMTKCFFASDKKNLGTLGFMSDLSKDKTFVNQFGLSRGAIFKSVDESLGRLGTDYIDLLQIHRYDYSVEPEEVMGALNDLVKSGKVRYIGASSMWAYQFATLQHVAETHGWAKFVSMQDCYNLLYREEEREMIPYCLATGVGLVPYSPLSAGALARPLRESSQRSDFSNEHMAALVPKFTADQEDIIGRVAKIAEEKGWRMSDVALAWVLKTVSSPIVGVNSAERLEQIAGVNGKTLTPEEIKFLEEPYLPHPIRGHK
ncbi:NADP-dependent oxidoreductase domain-containing protein [Limtongia smithiae]|uniref:NADP-dependent oxidoreductase domain-containing protein n=1 Tax=Limtongia smithiae TaxID=1125753 RepID=UPI0034CDE275